MEDLFDSFGLPKPAKTSNILLRLEGNAVARANGRGRVWSLTPVGRARSEELLSDLDVASLIAEATRGVGSFLGGMVHTVVPPPLAPPSMLPNLKGFLDDHPFERNVLGMTRFPDEADAEDPDPLKPVLDAAREVCAKHGLEFHLASDRDIEDDLWQNVAAHMWASRYGIAFFEDRRGRGINYNLTIEVGAMLMTGRRTAILKDRSSPNLPTDLVGKIYKSVDLDDLDAVKALLHAWIRDDLRLTSCPECPAAPGKKTA